MLSVYASVFAPVITVLAFVVGVKMAEGRERRAIARLQRQNMELEDNLQTAKAQIFVYEQTIGKMTKDAAKPPPFVIQEEAV